DPRVDGGGETLRPFALEDVQQMLHVVGLNIGPQRPVVLAPDVREGNREQAEHEHAQRDVDERQSERRDPKESDHAARVSSTAGSPLAERARILARGPRWVKAAGSRS